MIQKRLNNHLNMILYYIRSILRYYRQRFYQILSLMVVLKVGTEVHYNIVGEFF